MGKKTPYFKNFENFASWELRQAFWTLVHNRGIDNVSPPPRPRRVISRGTSWMDSWKFDSPRRECKTMVAQKSQELEAPEYKADHLQLLEMLKKAIQAGERFGGVERLDSMGERINSLTPIARDSFLKWVLKNKTQIFPLRHFPENEEDLLLRLVEIFSESKKHEDKKKEEFFPAPSGTKWDKVDFELTKSAHIKVCINKKSKDFHPDVFKEYLPGQSRIILYNIINSGGFLDPENIKEIEPDNLKHAVSRFRKKMQNLFKIMDDPLPFESGRYKAQFSACSQVPPPQNYDH